MSLARVRQIEIAEYRDGTRIRHYLNPRNKHECIGITLIDSEFNSIIDLIDNKTYIILCKTYGDKSKLFTVPNFSEIPRGCEYIIFNSDELKDLREAVEIYSGTVRHCS